MNNYKCRKKETILPLWCTVLHSILVCPAADAYLTVLYRLHSSPLTCLTITDDQLIAAGSTFGNVAIADQTSGQKLGVLKSAFAPTGNQPLSWSWISMMDCQLLMIDGDWGCSWSLHLFPCWKCSNVSVSKKKSPNELTYHDKKHFHLP